VPFTGQSSLLSTSSSLLSSASSAFSSIDPSAVKREDIPQLVDWKKTPFSPANEYTRRHRWAQILNKGEDIARHASDAHRRDFTIEEIQRVEALALAILSEVRKLLSEEKPPETAIVPTGQTLTFIPANINPSAPSLELVNGSPADHSMLHPDDASTPKKRRGRPPIKKPLFCAECGTTETPEWRRGENGPNTLCNGCGLRYAKRRKQEMESKKKHSLDMILASNEKREAMAKAAAAAAAALNADNGRGLGGLPVLAGNSGLMEADRTVTTLSPSLSPLRNSSPTLSPTHSPLPLGAAMLTSSLLDASLVIPNDPDTTQILITHPPPSNTTVYPANITPSSFPTLPPS